MTRLLRASALVAAIAIAAPAHAEPVFPSNGRIGLEPPRGMVEASGFAGFAAADGGSITLAEMPAEAFDQVAASFGQKPLPHGLTLGEPQTLTLADGKTATLFAGTQEVGSATFRKWALIARGEDITALASVQLPVGSEVMDAQVRTALASLTLRPAAGLEAEADALPFAIGDLAGFRLVRTLMGSAALLTEGALDVDPAGTQPLVIVASSLGPVAPSDRAAYSARAFEQLSGFEGQTIEKAETLPDGSERIAGTAAREGGGLSNIRQIIRFGAEGYVRIICTAPTEIDIAERCDRLAASVRFPR